MTNMVSAAELNNDEEYQDIKEDITTECSGYGKVVSLVIPRAKDGYPQSNEGLIFVEFYDAAMARTCAIALSGRKFDSRIVIVDYVSVVLYDQCLFCMSDSVMLFLAVFVQTNTARSTDLSQ